MVALDDGNRLDKFLGFGIYQLLVYVASQYALLPCCLNMAFMTFGGYKPKWTCNDSEAIASLNQTPTDNCIVYAECLNLSYHSPFNSIVMEWDLNCDQKHIPYIITSIQMTGVAIGAMIFGQLSDLYGRRRTILMTETGLVIFGGLSALSTNWPIFCVIRFVIGIFVGGAAATVFVYVTEFCGKKHRLWMNALGGWPLMFVVFAGLACTFPTWRRLSVFGNLISAPVVLLFLLLDESPRWLIQHQKITAATKVLNRINHLNRRNFKIEELKQLMAGNPTQKLKISHHSICYLFSKKILAIRVSVLAISWVTASMIQYGILFNIDSISGDPFLNLAYYGAMRLCGNTTVVIIDTVFKKFGRKMLHAIPELFIALSSIAIIIIISTGNTETFHGLIRILALVCAAECSCLWVIGQLLSAELFPTSVRTLAGSFCSFWARIGGVIVPQLLLLAHYWSAAPYVCFAALAIIDMIAFQLVIPETKGRPLPEHQYAEGVEMESKTKYEENLL